MAGNGDDLSRHVIHSGAIPVCRISSMAPELPGIYRDRSGSHYADGLFATASDTPHVLTDSGGTVNGNRLGVSLDHFHRSEEHTSELQSLMRISYAVFFLKKKKIIYLILNF